jgi:hypothetical protein
MHELRGLHLCDGPGGHRCDRRRHAGRIRLRRELVGLGAARAGKEGAGRGRLRPPQRFVRPRRAAAGARFRRGPLPAPELHPAVPLQERPGRGGNDRPLSHVGDQSRPLLQRDGPRRDDPVQRSQQRWLRSRRVPGRADRTLRFQHGRRLHRDQVGAERRRPPDRRAGREHRHPRLRDAGRPRGGRRRQRDIGRRSGR